MMGLYRTHKPTGSPSSQLTLTPGIERNTQQQIPAQISLLAGRRTGMPCWINKRLHSLTTRNSKRRWIIIPSSNYLGQGDYFHHRITLRVNEGGHQMNRTIEAQRNRLWAEDPFGSTVDKCTIRYRNAFLKFTFYSTSLEFGPGRWCVF